MGGAVSSGRDNNELIDNLMGGNYIRTRSVERVFRALDRAEYMTPETRDQAYKDLAWRNGPLHLSAPCIYSEVMENLKLKPGLSFLNIGSGTGYLSTLVGLILGSSGISHGVEVRPFVVDYANKKLSQFMENSPVLDEFDFCEPKFYVGNGLCLAPLQTPYDRVYCGAGCPVEYENYFKQLIKVGGILVMPLNDNLVQMQRVSETEWNCRMLLNVSFAPLREPAKNETQELIRLEEQKPARLQALARAAVRGAMRAALQRRRPELRPPARAPPRAACPRRICIPVEDDSDLEGLNVLHDLDRNSGANEMNALLSLVLSMGQNRVAGALRFDTGDTSSDSSSDDDEQGHDDDDDNDDDDDGNAGNHSQQALDLSANDEEENRDNPPRASHSRGLLTFEFHNMITPGSNDVTDSAPRSPPPDNATSAQKSVETDRAQDKTTTKSEDRGDSSDNPNVPAEVEIYLGKTSEAAASTSKEGEMEWEESVGATRESFSDEETTEEGTKSKEEKRQKLDSGIGENTPTSSSPAKTDTKTDESDADGSHHSDSLTDDIDDDTFTGRRRLQKRSRGSPDARSSSGEPCSEPEAEGAPRRRRKRRPPPPRAPRAARATRAARAARGNRAPRPPHHADDARRVQLSLCMKRAVKELPLPYALKKYVNLQRCFEF
ncbi:uncharacterized protein LOC113517190 [Galleria mellonella]|uniref:Uncharacterized protein LOC113517190 n=1 Tax=Galleria mellonella TaxID=7137 RepID=A0ABM3MM58_GALME|nr:uncharacterized protein LOC113517190 [Galleria mellonella]